MGQCHCHDDFATAPGIYLAHYAMRGLLAQAAVEAELDPDRFSFTEGLFELT